VAVLYLVFHNCLRLKNGEALAIRQLAMLLWMKFLINKDQLLKAILAAAANAF
jgi:hypothetical protein